MKKYLMCVLLLLTGVNNFISAQNVSIQKDELNKILCKQWKIDYAMMGGMRIDQLPNGNAFELKFNSDNTYTVIKKNSTETGKWNYDIKNKYIELSIKNKITSRIISIDKNEIILALVGGKQDPPDLSTIQTYLIPK